jgi:cephalosporin-C deacetylase-like acetyl esterase
MPCKDISFKTADGVTLRGWFYTPDSSLTSEKLPCLIMAHGFTALKEMELDTFAAHFTSHLPISCLVYDNRNFGASDSSDPDNKSRFEIVPAQQVADYSDAITFAQTELGDQVDGERIAVWGSSYSGGHVLVVGAVDRRVSCVLSQV